jgi:zinc transporter ZupT
MINNAAPSVFQVAAEEVSEHQTGKILAIVFSFVLHLGAGLSPWVIQNMTGSKTVISFATCLAAGAMLSIGLIHVLAEARVVFEEYLEADEDDHGHSHSLNFGSRHALGSHSGHRTLAEEEGHSHPFPWTELLAGLVVLLLISVEMIVMRYLQRRGNIEHCHGHGHGHEDDHEHVEPRRSVTAPVSAAKVDPVAEYGTLSDSLTPPQPEHCLDVHAHVRGHTHTHVPCEGDAHSHVGGEIRYAEDVEQGIPPFDGIKDAEPSRAIIVEDDAADEETVVVDKDTADRIRSQKLYLDAFISSVAICTHCLFEGLALGAGSSSDSAFWTFFGVTIGHKIIDGFAAGVPIHRAKMSFFFSFMLNLLGALATPLGIIIGYFSASSSEASLGQAVVMAMSAGSFLFVACFELIPAGLGKGTSWLLLKLFTMFAGFGIVAAAAQGHSH